MASVTQLQPSVARSSDFSREIGNLDLFVKDSQIYVSTANSKQNKKKQKFLFEPIKVFFTPLSYQLRTPRGEPLPSTLVWGTTDSATILAHPQSPGWNTNTHPGF